MSKKVNLKNRKIEKADNKLVMFYKKRLDSGEGSENLNYIYGLRNPVGLYMKQRTQKIFIDTLNRNSLYLSNKKILDVGCGCGDWLRFFAEIRGCNQDLVGIDITSHRINRAKLANPGIEFIVGNATKLSFPDNSFDIVTQFFTFEHLLENSDLKKAAKEVSRVLKDQGIFIWFDLLPFSTCDSSLTRGYSLKNIKKLFPDFELVDYKFIFKNFNIFHKKIDSVRKFPKYSFILTDLAQKIPFGKYNNLLVIMRK